MAQRTVCLCDGKYIGIETIYTVINGQQINIPDKLKELRVKSQNNELFCPCGCGANLILVAGDRNLREQHFRLKDGSSNEMCHVTTEGKISVDSKIVLKCWLDDALKTSDVEARVPIQALDGSGRKYEFSFLSRNRKIALSYCHDRAYLSDEKFELLEGNRLGIHIIYVVDIGNIGSNGQYPEGLMKVQKRQGYCLLLNVMDASYNDAVMSAVFFAQDVDGLWREVKIAEGKLNEFSIDAKGSVLFESKSLISLLENAERTFGDRVRREKIRCMEESQRQADEQKRRLEEAENRREEWKKRQAEAERERRQRQEEEQKRREEIEAKRQAEIKRREDDFRRNMADNFTQQEEKVIDAQGNRWIKCKYCGLIAVVNDFSSYGGTGEINLGICKSCCAKGKIPSRTMPTGKEESERRIKYDASVCPECGGKLLEKSGVYGKFIGCSNYPRCQFTRKISQRSQKI